ncbi:putative double-strand break repair protein [Clavispora lusitaniae]|uniref:Double-strand break repair protein n=1 Tax=Clavispora lusitaniae TaxID=36911 RepID=A0ACD0WSY8_CLALS|nr:meiotic recombination [Clavispora lusitaniae]QFZ30493.1 putative double-strand break repair protein [Clavispora lusitaniae]QFZ36155.1 putative double-strand break repair protein [Clavispora lusitaniae]QFZ41839.1 putative double-strand break repair protein [Clavispora lusitaniae]QFZ47515.1 putative double-strand break repair protein [Clavispora lusitaniae]
MPPIASIPAGPNRLRILVTSDNHVGYLENDPVRGDDSWKTFQETMRLAQIHDADMVVQGGDMFHVTRPSKKALFHVIQALRLNCLGDRPCELELLSDPALALRSGDSLNYEDPNLNVAVPVFAISGNHDDATGSGLLSPLDVVAATGLVNYFGQIPRDDKISLAPILLQKGTTRLALYGLNNLRDERLQRLMRDGKVTFQKPRERFFSILCLHQNHARHSISSYVPEDFLPSFLDLVIWGHEHECILDPQYNPATGFDTLQPGSTVATSLSEGETAPKHVFLVDVLGEEYSIKPIRLQTVRPFVMRDISLQREHFVEGPASKRDIADFLVSQVEEMIEQAKQDEENEEQDETHEKTSSENMLPLIRLRVDHTGDYEVENARRFSNRFVGRVANVNDILLYHQKKASRQPQRKLAEPQAREPSNVSIQQLLQSVLGDSSLFLVAEDRIFDATKKFIEQDDKEVLAEYVEKAVEDATKSLLQIGIDEAEFHKGDTRKGFRQLLNQLRREAKRKPIDDESWQDSPKESVPEPEPVVLSEEDEPKKRAPRAKAAPKKATTTKPKAAPRRAKRTHDQSLLDDILSLGS